jgi:uncharacterized membrane protein YqaE (UPF0057 family)
MNDQHKNALLFIACIVFPPLATLLMAGVGVHLIINIVLCLVGYIPGMIHALWMFFNQKGR